MSSTISPSKLMCSAEYERQNAITVKIRAIETIPFSRNPCPGILSRYTPSCAARSRKPAVQYRMDADHIRPDSVIDRKRKTLRQGTVVTPHDRMNSGVDDQRIDV